MPMNTPRPPQPLPPGIAPEMLRAVFQPIFRLATSEVLGYEALLRGPVGTAMESPAALFATAQDAASAIALELTAAQIAIHAFSAMRLPGKPVYAACSKTTPACCIRLPTTTCTRRASSSS